MDVLAWISILGLIFSIIVIMITLGRIGPISGAYFDAALTKKHIDLPLGFAPLYSMRCGRGAVYLLIMLTNGNPYKKLPIWWPKLFKKTKNNTWVNFNYRAIARKRDWVLAIIFFGAYSIFIFSATTGCIVGALQK